MESLKKLNCLLANGGGEKLAIILCSQNEVVTRVTYNEVGDFADRIRKFVQKNVLGDNICIGLLMQKNVFIPSIILSFQELHYSFVFLTPETLLKTNQEFNIKWVLSYEDDSLKDNFILEDILHFSIKKEIKLWKNNCYLENGKNLSFKDIFCAVQTSGSTGENKIVRVPHSCIEKNVLSLNKHFGLTNNDTIYWGTPLTFDPSLVEFLLGLFCQATLVIVPKLVSLNPKFLYDALFMVGQVSFLQIVPSVFLRWNKQQIVNIVGNSCLRTLAFGGEPFPQEILTYERNSTLKIFNLYGVTELSCWATIFNVTSEVVYENQVLLGETLDETFVELRTSDNGVIVNGVGEIYIGSNTRYCLLGDSEGNLAFPFIIKTGDIGELSHQGLIYRGRNTRTVKRFGQKVNLHKIEEKILKEMSLSSRLVFSLCHKKLLAFILIEEYFNKNTKIRLLDKLRVKMLNIVSEAEFPDYIDVVTHFPLNEHGKICDKVLEKYYEHSLSNLIIAKQDPRDIFVHILSQYLRIEFSNNLETFGKHTFFELGGNSILAIQLLSEFEDYTMNDVSGELVTLLLNDNIQSCISHVQSKMVLKRKLVENSVLEKPKKLMIENRETNSVIWRYDFKGCVDSSPLVFKRSDKTCVASGSFAHMFAILNDNGDEYLKLILPQEVESKPCISKCGNIIFTGCSNGSMYCIDISLREIAWEYRSLQKVTGTACLCKGSNAIVFGSYDNFVYCLTIKEGDLIWNTKLIGSIRTGPVYSENSKTIYVGTTKGICYALDEENGTVIWTHKLDGPIFGAPCIVNNNIVWPCVTGVLYCISSSGDLKWTQKINSNIFSSLSVYEDKIYFGCHDSKVYEISLNDNNCKISNTFQLESEISSTPFVYKYGNKILIVCVCNVGILYVIDINSGKIVFRHKLPAESFSSPNVFKNRVYVGCRDNNLYCIDIKKTLIS